MFYLNETRIPFILDKKDRESIINFKQKTKDTMMENDAMMYEDDIMKIEHAMKPYNWFLRPKGEKYCNIVTTPEMQ